MQARFWKLWNTDTRSSLSLPFYVKCGAILLLFSLSVLVVACSSTGSANALTVQNPPVTVTINLNNNNFSPTPPLKPYWCSAWATNTTPVYNGSTTVGIYAKFVHNVNLNPVGVGGATATATIIWPDSTSSTSPSVTTTDDGLAVFSVSAAGKVGDVNKFTYVTVTFHKDGIPNDCTTAEGAAFFVLVGASPTATTATPSVSPIPSPGTTPIVSPTPTCTPFPFPPPPRPGKKPTPTPKPGC